MLNKFRGIIKPIFVDKVTRWLFLASLIINLASWGAVLVRFFALLKDGRQVTLHYNVYLNVNSIGPAGWLLLPIAAGTLILLGNTVLAAYAYRTSRPNAVTLMFITAFYELLILAAAVFVLLLNLAN